MWADRWHSRLQRLRKHHQRDQWCHQKEEAGLCATGAVAVVTLTAAYISSNSCFNLLVVHIRAYLLGGATLQHRLLTSNSHWESENHVSVWVCGNQMCMWDSWVSNVAAPLPVVEMQWSSLPSQLRVPRHVCPLQLKHFIPLGVDLIGSVTWNIHSQGYTEGLFC